MSSTCKRVVIQSRGRRFKAVTSWIHHYQSRAFSKSSKFALATPNTAPPHYLSELRINRERLMRDIHHTCQWGTGERWGDGENDTGMSRLSLSDSDREVRNWFVETAKQLGCIVTIDAMGNIFAVRPGKKAGPPTCVGSHLDTQPSGGRYDGILGVCAGLEMLRVLSDEKVETQFPVGVINWTNEEGARFPISMVSSGVWAGEISLETAHNLKEVGSGSQTMKQELERIGYLGDTPCSYQAVPIAAHFELHIEQGPRLESSKQEIGIVQGVQAYRWYTITVRGRECHTGTTDFANRADALLASARMIISSRRVASYRSALASTGILTLSPGSVNTVPGTVQFSLDIRAAGDEQLLSLEKQLEKKFRGIADTPADGDLRGHKCTVKWQLDAPSKAVKFDGDCIRCVRETSIELFGDEAVQNMTSGAGHDSVFTSKRVPTSMIFVPCKDGVSHHPAEYCAPKDCGNGAQVLLGSVLRYDRLRVEKANA